MYVDSFFENAQERILSTTSNRKLCSVVKTDGNWILEAKMQIILLLYVASAWSVADRVNWSENCWK